VHFDFSIHSLIELSKPIVNFVLNLASLIVFSKDDNKKKKQKKKVKGRNLK
jgi:hypothetical protein